MGYGAYPGTCAVGEVYDQRRSGGSLCPLPDNRGMSVQFLDPHKECLAGRSRTYPGQYDHRAGYGLVRRKPYGVGRVLPESVIFVEVPVFLPPVPLRPSVCVVYPRLPSAGEDFRSVNNVSKEAVTGHGTATGALPEVYDKT